MTLATYRAADGDQPRDQQYRDSSKLAARAGLHAKYGRGDWFPWVAAQHDWPAQADVLDVGCGAGWFWAGAAAQLPMGFRLELADLSSGMVAEAVARTRAVGRYASVAGRVADAAALPFADATFDVVLACHMLHHLPLPGRGIAEIRRVLRLDGVALITANGRANLRELFALAQSSLGGTGDDPTAATFGIEVATPVLAAAFDCVELRTYPDVLRCTDPDDVYAYLTSFPPGDTASTAQLSALRSGLAAAFARGGGELRITKDIGLFRCRRTT